MQAKNLFPLNSAELDPFIKGGIPLAFELHEDVVVGAMVAGVKTVDVTSNFGKGVGQVVGIIPLKTREAANVGLVYAVATSSVDGKVTITQNSTSNSSTTNVTNTFLLVGRITPIEVVES